MSDIHGVRYYADGPIRDAARDGMVAFLERNGYDIPGLADICAGIALKAVYDAGVRLEPQPSPCVVVAPAQG